MFWTWNYRVTKMSIVNNIVVGSILEHGFTGFLQCERNAASLKGARNRAQGIVQKEKYSFFLN